MLAELSRAIERKLRLEPLGPGAENGADIPILKEAKAEYAKLQ